MKFAPKTEREIAEEGMMPDGTICDFEVIEAQEAVSKAGNEMIELKLTVWRPNGAQMSMRDWLVSTRQGKVLAFAKAVGMREAYDAGEFRADDLAGKAGKLKVGVDPGDGNYPPRNKVKTYVMPDANAPVAPARQKVTVDDDIPF